MSAQRKRPAAPAPTAVLRPTPRSAKAAVRREQLLSTALELFVAHGYAGTSTKRIADAAGVTEGLIFHYFGTKDGLLLESMARQNTFAGRVLANVRRASDGSARELFAAVASAYAEVSAEEMALVGFFEAEAQTNRSLRTSVVAGTEMMVTDFSALLALRVQRGELRPTASLRAAAYGFFGGFSFFFAQHRDATAAAWRSEAARFASAWSDQCWRGLATPSALALVDGPTLSEGSVTRAAGRRRKKAT